MTQRRITTGGLKLYTLKFSIIFLAAVFISATTYSQPKTSEPILSHGSIIITLITNDSIVIAADSKQSNRNNPNSYTNNFKIGSGNNFYYAIAGNLIRLSKQNSADTLDVYKIMDSIIKKTDNIDTIAPTFFRAVHKKYWDIVGDIVAKTVFELQDSINTTAIDLELLTFDGAVPIYRFYQFGFFKREIIPGVAQKKECLTAVSIPVCHFIVSS